MIVESYVCPSLICLPIWLFAFHKTFNSSLIYFFEISGKRTPNQKRHPKVAKNDFSDDDGTQNSCTKRSLNKRGDHEMVKISE